MKKVGAFVVGNQSNLEKPLHHIGRDIGFSRLLAYSGIDMVKQQIGQTPLCFFLCAETVDPVVLSPVLHEIRKCPRRNIRFAPIVYFCESPCLDTIALCAALGFDDVLTMPFTPHRVSARLFRLMSRPQTYLETDTYLGPPRKNLAHSYTRRFDFKRDSEWGIKMVHEEFARQSTPQIGHAA